MTKALYMTDCYLKTCTAKVIEANGLFIVLDQTIFYPESGGQLTDTGKMTKDGTVYHVRFAKKIAGNITHEVDKQGLKQGDEVTVELDWERRHTMMRYHTAAHLLSATIFNETKAMITGNQLKLTGGRIDFSLEDFDREAMERYVKETNELVEKEIPVSIKLMPASEAFKIPSIFRLKDMLPPSVKEIRVVAIEGIDAQACAGTHVKNTKEVGKIVLEKVDNKGKNNRRLYFHLE
ncbi:alanyl-tRNA editing protein [Candidatus Woesearchaeota archaeon]|nr:alanyl-tRNA editing protein [Candidatus Woesearchaeota archaeon]